MFDLVYVYGPMYKKRLPMEGQNQLILSIKRVVSHQHPKVSHLEKWGMAAYQEVLEESSVIGKLFLVHVTLLSWLISSLYIQQLREGVHNFFVTFIEALRDRPPGHDWELEPGVTCGDYLFGMLQVNLTIELTTTALKISRTTCFAGSCRPTYLLEVRFGFTEINANLLNFWWLWRRSRVIIHQNQYYSRSSKARNGPARFGSFGSPYSIGFKESPSPPSNIYCLSPCKQERDRHVYKSPLVEVHV
ncbi:unnamed protein product [Camellia sinensis]